MRALLAIAVLAIALAPSPAGGSGAPAEPAHVIVVPGLIGNQDHYKDVWFFYD